MQYAKLIVTLVGAGITTALGLIPPTTTLWIVLTIVSAMLTAYGVYKVPNAPASTAPAKSEDTTP
jgi:NAD-dependent SIR2 family protein deacetylase